VFRWRKRNDGWIGVIGETVVRLTHGPKGIEVESGERGIENRIIHYFRIADAYESILRSVNKDSFMYAALRNLKGLRLIRQDPWECMISYICATNSNIPSIVNMIENLCRKFGEQIEFDGDIFHSFPSPARLAAADIFVLKECRVGYRAGFIKTSATRILSDDTIFSQILSGGYIDGMNVLTSKSLGKKMLPGIGRKVADCMLLFSLEKMEAFPIDTWILRTILGHYSQIIGIEYATALKSKLKRTDSLSPGDYARIAVKMRNYFGVFAGYAQEFLYYYSRGKGRWNLDRK
jgi:N-glycosylase/DNA lyase